MSKGKGEEKAKAKAKAKAKGEIILLYDGECPICKQYGKYIELRKKYDVKLFNAREHLDLTTKLKSQGYDINQGMILIAGGQIYHRDEVLVVLETMTEAKGTWDRILRLAVRNPKWMKRIYPLLKGFRWMMLKLMGKDSQIGP